MRFRQRLAGESGGEAGVEVGTLRDVLVRAFQSVADGLAGGLSSGDVRVEFAEFALQEPPAVIGFGVGEGEGLLLSDREPGVAVEQDGRDEPCCRRGVATLSGNPGRRREQARFLVIAQGRGGYAGAAGEFADGEERRGGVGPVDFKRT